jgi:epsilon-lactone hydrolase
MPGIPPPPYVSEAARKVLTAPPYPARPPYPALDDAEAWRKQIRDTNAQLETLLFGDIGTAARNRVKTEQIDGVTVYRAQPATGKWDDARVFLHIHGGALILLGGEGAKLFAAQRTEQVSMPVISVDYRMPPDHPYPVGLDDCVAVYRQLVKDYGADNIVIGGESAGGNLAAAAVLKARDQGVPLPAGVVLLSPEIDLTEKGDTFTTLEGVDFLWRHLHVNLLYAAGTPLDHPYVSPLFGDFSQGFPRTFIQSGTRDLLLSNSVNIHRALRRAGIEAHLHVWEAMPHGGFRGAPEDAEVDQEVRQFIAQCW